MQLLLTALFSHLSTCPLDNPINAHSSQISNPEPSPIFQPCIPNSARKSHHAMLPMGLHKTLGLLPNTFKPFLTEPLKSPDSIYRVTHKTQTSKPLFWALKTHYDLISIYFSRHFYLSLLQKGHAPVKWTQ